MKLLERLRFNLHSVSEQHCSSGADLDDLGLFFLFRYVSSSGNLHCKSTVNGKLALTEAIPSLQLQWMVTVLSTLKELKVAWPDFFFSFLKEI